jgi:predicted GIY-YIG superfamily endonuclease
VTKTQILATVKGCRDRAEWIHKNPSAYHRAYYKGWIKAIWNKLPPSSHNTPTYTRYLLKIHARGFKSREEWRKSGLEERRKGIPSHYHIAVDLGSEFFQLCCAHMEDQRKFNKLPHRVKYTDEELIEAAKQYKHKCEWRRANKHEYHACWRRKELWKIATAHMTPAWNYYNNNPRCIYACEFPDRHVYVGLTTKPGIRHAEHRSDEISPAYRHYRKTGEPFKFVIVARNLFRASEAQVQENTWHNRYALEGWTMLNVAKPGSLGWSHPTEWTRELCLDSAQRFFYRTEWLLAEQPAYKAAKRLGCFEEAVAHMPQRRRRRR